MTHGTSKPLIFGSVCSGIEAASVAWHPLGWKAAFYSEIEPFPRAILQHHYPHVPLHGDFTTIQEHDYDPIDLLVGGTPCQAFSVAGLRKGFADERGNLTLEFVRLAQRLRPRWLVWENVPGVLSQDRGRAFGSFLGALAECGYGFAYRVLDAQYFGVPQRRRRVFVVGYLGDWRPPAAALFESESLRGDITPSRKTGENAAGTLTARTCRSLGTQDAECGHMIIEAIPINTQIATRHEAMGEGTGLGIGVDGDPAFTLQSAHSHAVGVFKSGQGAKAGSIGYSEFLSPTLSAAEGSNRTPSLLRNETVRRLTPLECERLQQFPDNYTLVPFRGKPVADGNRYKAIGNSMHTGTMRWIGERISMVESQLAI